jgi:hypothetical protein
MKIDGCSTNQMVFVHVFPTKTPVFCSIAIWEWRRREICLLVGAQIVDFLKWQSRKKLKFYFSVVLGLANVFKIIYFFILWNFYIPPTFTVSGSLITKFEN